MWLSIELLPGLLNLLVLLGGELPESTPEVDVGTATVGLVVSLVFGWAPVVGIGWTLRARGRRWEDIGFTRLRGADAGWGVLLAVVSWFMVIILAAVFSKLGLGVREVEFLSPDLPLWFLIVDLTVLSVTAGVTEEVVFRGYAQTRLEQLGMPAAVILLLPTGLWGVLHAYQGWGAAAAIFCLGLLYASLFQFTRRLWPIIIAHTLFDITQLVIYLTLRL